ncbi:hypothetical protein BCR44DRAFT_36945 [Catenaria anguillulae PL171]|uniref:Uncharacterized protein n=1 Tax=Catenaria anguillulae PL171 TaxID=765915 RepID=A0A1Y2HAP2_9FUNG|nr:hypothetical protein BCR44DRAFT_36945 [Catenaria anguillulae PL171]
MGACVLPVQNSSISFLVPAPILGFGLLATGNHHNNNNNNNNNICAQDPPRAKK